jgi:hypothetical protein
MVETAPPATAVSPLRTNRRFQLAFLAQVLFAIVAFVPFAHLVGIALGNGWSSMEGVELISILGLGSTVGRFLVVPVAHRVGSNEAASLFAYVMSASLAVMGLVQQHGIIFADVIIFGLTYGGIIALTAPINAEIFGLPIADETSARSSARAPSVFSLGRRRLVSVSGGWAVTGCQCWAAQSWELRQQFA